MRTDWFQALADACGAGDETTIVAAAAAALGADARVTVWRRDRTGWVHATGDDRTLPATLPAEPRAVVVEDDTVTTWIGEDDISSRLLAVAAPALDDSSVRAATRLLAVALGTVVAREESAYVARRLDDNERIGRLGSYDWHIPTDTNRWSDELYRIYGEEPQSFNASYERFLGFIHEDDREKVQQIHQTAFQSGEPYEMEERIVLADGTERLLWSNGEVIPGPDGAPERFIGICRDVTEERAAQRAAERAEEHKQAAHDAEIRRRAALELNDAVVQGLTAAAWSFEMGAEDVGRHLLDSTLESARAMMDDLLHGVAGETLGAGELRRTEAPAKRIEELPSAPTPPPADETTAALRVVVADDAVDVRELLQLQLRALGVDVVGAAADGAEAVELVAEHRPDAVLLDLSMPVMDGLEATAAIRATNADVRIIVLSGWASHTMADGAREAGADEYLEKGLDLRDRIAVALGLVSA